MNDVVYYLETWYQTGGKVFKRTFINGVEEIELTPFQEVPFVQLGYYDLPSLPGPSDADRTGETLRLSAMRMAVK